MIRSKEIAEALYTLNDRSIKYLDITNLQEALQIYQQQGVGAMVIEHNHIKTSVRDNQVFTVKLNINLLGNSQCSCSNKEICAHLVAVYFAAYAFQGFRPDIIVKKALEQHENKHVEPTNSPASKTSSAPSSKAKKNIEPVRTKTAAANPHANLTIQSEGSIASWHSYFQAKFKQFPSSSGFVDYRTILNTNTKAFTLLSHNWPANKQRLFQMHIFLFQLQKLEESYFTSNNRTYYYSHGINEAIQECYERLYQSLVDISKIARIKLDFQHLEQTAAHLSILAFPEKKSPIDWNYFYCLIWDLVIVDAELLEAEKARLLNYVKQKDLTPHQKENGNLALAFSWFVLGNDANATKCIEQSGLKIALEFCIQFIGSLQKPHQTPRMLFWLNWLKPHMSNALKHELEQYLEFWAALVPAHITEEAYLQTIADFLPKSSPQYTSRLIDQENYAALLDYMLAMQIPLSHLPTGMIRKIELKEAQLLLPHYHHAVENAIILKNREAYKRAVKAMRKLQLLYKKLKQFEQWERYLAWIRSHYSRLSALHEEMAKGLK